VGVSYFYLKGKSYLKSINPKPAKLSVDDKYAAYRRKAKNLK